jgi:hypothetical protein
MASQNRLFDDFFAQHYAYARAAGLPDVAARLAAVQASIESDWGRHAPRNNYHGIKAGKYWSGKTQSLMTTEDDGSGRRYSIKDKFRVYDSPAASHTVSHAGRARVGLAGEEDRALRGRRRSHPKATFEHLARGGSTT